MIFTTEEMPVQRQGWIYEEAPGGGYYGYLDTARPYIQWNHIDGPLLHFRNGEVHWLTLWERFCCFWDIHDALTLEKKYRPRLYY